MHWQIIFFLSSPEFQFPIRPVKVPSGSRIPLEGVKLLIHGPQFCVTALSPPRILQCWNVADLRRFGAVDGKFCFEGGSRCGKGERESLLVVGLLRWFCFWSIVALFWLLFGGLFGVLASFWGGGVGWLVFFLWVWGGGGGGLPSAAVFDKRGQGEGVGIKQTEILDYVLSLLIQ